MAARTERPPSPTRAAWVPPEVHVLSSNPVPFDARRTGPPADTPDARRSPLDRFLNLFTDVRSGESITALLLMLDVFVILAAYYLLKTIREPLIINRTGGAEMKSYSAAAIAGILVVLVPLYSALASRVSRLRLINGVTLFFIACLVAFFVVHRAGYDVGVPFFIWVAIFNVMIIAQMWAFANDVYTVEQGKRLFAIVGFGASLGAIAGSFFTGELVQSYGPYPFMLGAALLLAVSMLITNLINRRERRTVPAAPPASAEPAVAEGDPAAGPTAETSDRVRGRSGFMLVLTDRYLGLIAALMVLLNLVNTTGEYILGKRVSEIATSAASHAAGIDPEKMIGAFYGNYFTWVNVISALIQALVVSRVLKYVGVRGALLVLPVVALAGYTTLAFVPMLAFIKGVKIAENSLDYSLQNTTRNALYLPLSREAKYKAKQANDTFFVRFGDVLSAGLIFVGTTWLAFAPRQFALVNAGLVLLWLVLALVLGRRFAKLAHTA